MTNQGDKEKSIPEQLRDMSDHMKDVACKMEYYGGFNAQIKDKAQELLGAAYMAMNWADAIEGEIKNGEWVE